MAFTPGNSLTVTNSTTPVTFVAAPAASTQRLVRTLTVYNADTVAATVSLSVYNGTTDYVFIKQTLVPGESLVFGSDGEVIVLDATTDLVRAVLAGAITTNQLQLTGHWADNTA